MSAYYQDDAITLHHGDALDVARMLPDGSVDCIVTSPPYYGLRNYGSMYQYGLEENPAAYVETMRALFSELMRVLADDGTLWLNVGDSYGKGKQLLGIPWRVAFALQDDGWVLRNSIIWHKPNAMPESVADRLSGRHENLFMFSKSQRYHFDLDQIREPQADVSIARAGRNRFAADQSQNGVGSPNTFDPASSIHANGKNPGDVWSINTQPFGGAHFAVMPQELARRAIIAGCKPGGTVLDPFSGSGTTGLVAQNNGRKYVGIEISADYLKLSLETRLQNGALDFGDAA
jgi:site-specific DNA-methyltransferase (cytosine-N4-specific)